MRSEKVCVHVLYIHVNVDNYGWHFIPIPKDFILFFIYFNIFIQDNKFSNAVFKLGPV